MIRESSDTLQSEANEVHPHTEAADQHIDVHRHEWHDEFPRPVRYLWPALMSFWQHDDRLAPVASV